MATHDNVRYAQAAGPSLRQLSTFAPKVVKPFDDDDDALAAVVGMQRSLADTIDIEGMPMGEALVRMKEVLKKKADLKLQDELDERRAGGFES